MDSFYLHGKQTAGRYQSHKIKTLNTLLKCGSKPQVRTQHPSPFGTHPSVNSLLWQDHHHSPLEAKTTTTTLVIRIYFKYQVNWIKCCYFFRFLLDISLIYYGLYHLFSFLLNSPFACNNSNYFKNKIQQKFHTTVTELSNASPMVQQQQKKKSIWALLGKWRRILTVIVQCLTTRAIVAHVKRKDNKSNQKSGCGKSDASSLLPRYRCDVMDAAKAIKERQK